MSPLTRRQFIGAASGLALAGNVLAVPARGLTINPRSSWGADRPPKGPLSNEDVRFLIVHHSASHNGHSASDVPGILRGWFDFHTGSRGWNDIAYNFVVDSEGGIWEARQGSIDGPVAGDATGGNQGFTQLVCLIGDTNTTPPTAAARASLVQLLAWLGERHDVSTAPDAEVTFISKGSNRWPAGTSVTTPTIAGHRDMSQTSCPGDHLYEYVTGSLRADVESIRGGSPPTTSAPSSNPTSSTSTAPPASTTAPPPTTTTIASTTTTIPTTTTSFPTTTTGALETTVAPTTTLPRPPSSTVAISVEQSTEAGSPLPGMIGAAGAVLAVSAGIAFWRQQRIGRRDGR